MSKYILKDNKTSFFNQTFLVKFQDCIEKENLQKSMFIKAFLKPNNSK